MCIKIAHYDICGMCIDRKVMTTVKSITVSTISQLLFFHFLYCGFFGHKVLLYTSDWLRTHDSLSASSSQVLQLQVCATMVGSQLSFCVIRASEIYSLKNF